MTGQVITRWKNLKFAAYQSYTINTIAMGAAVDTGWAEFGSVLFSCYLMLMQLLLHSQPHDVQPSFTDHCLHASVSMHSRYHHPHNPASSSLY